MVRRLLVIVKRVFAVALLLALIASLFLAGYLVSLNIPVTAMPQVLGAFTGAALAFVFFLLGQVMLRAYERARDHYNALVRLEHLLHEHLDIIGTFSPQIAAFRRNVESGKAFYELPKPLPVDPSIQVALNDIALVNRVASLSMLLRRGNEDIDTFRAAYSNLLDWYLTAGPGVEGNVDVYRRNAIPLVTQCGEVGTRDGYVFGSSEGTSGPCPCRVAPQRAWSSHCRIRGSEPHATIPTGQSGRGCPRDGQGAGRD